MKRVVFILSALAALAIFQAPTHAAETVVGSCGGKYTRASNCDVWIEVTGTAPRPGLFRFQPPGPFEAAGLSRGFDGTVWVGIPTGPGAKKPCADQMRDAISGWCYASVSFQDGRPTSHVSSIDGTSYSSGSFDVPVRIYPGIYHMAAGCGAWVTPCDYWPGAGHLHPAGTYFKVTLILLD